MYCFLVEKCILNCLNDHNEICPSHGSMSPRFMMSPDGIARMLYIAPEILFSDLDTNILIGPADTLTLVKLIGKGAFGEVYQGKLRRVRIHSKKSLTTCLCQIGKKTISQLFPLLRCSVTQGHCNFWHVKGHIWSKSLENSLPWQFFKLDV